jgi:hypothetical protein
MLQREARLQFPKPAGTQKADNLVKKDNLSGQSRRRKRSDFLCAYSSISLSQVLRVMLLVSVCFGFTKLSHVAQARPGAVVNGLVNPGFIGDLRNVR